MSLLLASCGEAVLGLFFCCDDDNFSLLFCCLKQRRAMPVFSDVATKNKMFMEMYVTLIALLVKQTPQVSLLASSLVRLLSCLA